MEPTILHRKFLLSNAMYYLRIIQRKVIVYFLQDQLFCQKQQPLKCFNLLVGYEKTTIQRVVEIFCIQHLFYFFHTLKTLCILMGLYYKQQDLLCSLHTFYMFDWSPSPQFWRYGQRNYQKSTFFNFTKVSCDIFFFLHRYIVIKGSFPQFFFILIYFRVKPVFLRRIPFYSKYFCYLTFRCLTCL